MNEDNIEIERIRYMSEYKVIKPMAFTITIKQKKIKHVYFKIKPENNFVEISIPIRFDEKALYEVIESKMSWMSLHYNQITTVHKPIKEKTYNKDERERLKARASAFIKIYEPVMNVNVNELRIKSMKTRWGTCNINQKRIWINACFCDKSDRLLEYIVVHEMVHLIEKGHNKRFYELMTLFLPDWEKRKIELNKRGGL